MKNLLLITALLGTLVLNAQAPAKGKVKIYLHSIRCDKPTADDLFDGDGKADEVFVTLFYSVASSNGTTKYTNKISTGVYGDNRNWPARTKAGTAGPTGGIKANDLVYAHPQTEERMPIGDERFKGLRMIELDLDAGDILTLIPVLWDWDGNNANTQNSAESYIYNAFNNVNVYMAPYAQRFDIRSANRIFGDNGSNCINMAGLTQILQAVNGTAGNRPIGMASNGSYNPQVFVFNSVILENWQTLSANFSGNRLPVQFDEPALGNNRDQGKYGLMIFPEFTKSAATNAPTNNGITRPIKTVNTIQTPNTNLTVAAASKAVFVGSWSGTHTNDVGLYPQAVNFELTSSNEFLMTVKATGAVAVRGTYALSGNTITGTYKHLSSGETFSFTGQYDNTTQQLSCTIGLGTATTGQGKWVMRKN